MELTPKNQQMRKLYEEVSQEMTALFYADFTGGEIAEFERRLERILENLERFEAGPR